MNVTLRQSAFVAPIISIPVYKHKKEYIPITVVTANKNQQGTYEYTAAKPWKAVPKPPAKKGATMKRQTNAYVVYLINSPSSGSTNPAFML